MLEFEDKHISQAREFTLLATALLDAGSRRAAPGSKLKDKQEDTGFYPDDDKMFDMFIAQERRIQFSKRRLSFLQAMIRGNELENQNRWRGMARSVV